MTEKSKEYAILEYLDECSEMIELFSKSLTEIEKGSFDKAVLDSMYRNMHTIKGSSHLFGFKRIGILAHAVESFLDPVRKSKINLNSLMVDALFKSCDVINSIIVGIKDSKKEPDVQSQIDKVICKLIEIVEGSVNENKKLFFDQFGLIDHVKHVENSNHKNTTSNFENLEIQKVSNEHMTEKIEKSQEKMDLQSETVRVHVALLDNLMNLVGEQVLIRNRLVQYSKEHENDLELAKMSQRLNVLTAEMQNEVMKTRMQPVGNVLTKFSRVVRDLGRELNKKINLVIHGAETELDKTVLEAVKDPLTHIIRNAIDHGIESPEERKKNGKNEVGTVTVKAYHESGHVIIENTDDGKGLSREKIEKKILEKKFLNSEALSKMSDKEIYSLVFMPGFSTAEKVSNISGRGVGMDVVKTNVEKIGGVVDIQSSPGLETTIKLKIPLTLAIVPALIVKALDQAFAIPQSSLVELVLIDSDQEKRSEKIEILQGSPVLYLREKILPLINLSEIFSKNTEESHLDFLEKTPINVVILNADSFLFGLVVDAIEDTADIVVKSLASFLKDLSSFSGATIMGDGTVALIIDVMGISKQLRANSSSDSDGSSNKSVDLLSKSLNSHESESAEFLLVDIGASSPYAIPLTVVSRLEEFSRKEIEFSGKQAVVRYRGSLLPIFSLPNFLGFKKDSKENLDDRIPVVVIRRGDYLYGIEVFHIQDVILVQSKIDQMVRDHSGIIGTMIFDEKVTVVVDVLRVIDDLKEKMSLDAGFTSKNNSMYEKSSKIEERAKKTILVAEDSSFFRNYVKQILIEEGYKVYLSCDGLDAWNALLEQGKSFDLLLSDIEMPNLNGYELAEKIKNDKNLCDIPCVAITTRFSASDIEKGKQSGFVKYLEKLNAETLISEIDEIIFKK